MRPLFSSNLRRLRLALTGPASCRAFRRAASLALAAALGACGGADETDALVKAHLAKRHIPGAAVAVVKNGQVIKAAGYGVADVEHAVPVTAETVFRIQSVSKQFTATGIMLLVKDGKVRLDDPVSRHLPAAPASWQKITVRHLLTHTSGLKDFINENDGALDLRVDATEEQVMQAVAPRPLNFAPGDAWGYSNTNYHLLAMIIRQASGRWYGDFLAARIFQPLGMTRTSVPRDGASAPGRATGYTMDNGRITPGAVLAPSITSYGGGGVLSTVLDLAKWDAALATGQLLPRATLEQMWTPVKLNNGTTHDYGFGWEIGAIAGHRRIWHGGDWTGFSAEIDRFVDDQLTVIVLTNLANAAPGRIARAIAGAYLPAVAPPAYQPIADKEPQATARFFDVLRRAREGSLRAEEFTPDVWAYIAPRVAQMRQDFAALGPVEKLTLVERTGSDGGKSYRYQARFKNAAFIFHFVVTPEDKISVMLPEEVNQ